MDKFNTHGGYFAPHGYTRVNTGGSHAENPNGGVQLGVDPNGVPNMLEEGEPVYNDFVFSDNIKANKKFLKDCGIPEKYAGRLYSKIADDYIKEAEMNPNDPISNNGLEAMLSRLADAQEAQKAAKSEKMLNEIIQQASPEQLEMLLQSAPSVGQQMPMTGQMPVEQMPVDEQMPIDEQMPAEEMPAEMPVEGGMPMMACGGKINRFIDGGAFDSDANPNVTPAGDVVTPDMARAMQQRIALENAAGDVAPVEELYSPARVYPPVSPPDYEPIGGLGALEMLSPAGIFRVGKLAGAIPKISKVIKATGAPVRYVDKVVGTIDSGARGVAKKGVRKVQELVWDKKGKLLDINGNPLHSADRQQRVKALGNAADAKFKTIIPAWKDASVPRKVVRTVGGGAFFGKAVPFGIEVVGDIKDSKGVKYNPVIENDEALFGNQANDEANEKANGGMINRLDGGRIKEAFVSTDRKPMYQPDALYLLNSGIGEGDIIRLSKEDIDANRERHIALRQKWARDEERERRAMLNDDSSLPSFMQYSGALASAGSMLYNLAQNPDRYEYQAYNPQLPTSSISLIDPEYNPIDQNAVVNDTMSSGAGNARALMNMGASPSIGANMVALDSNIGRNIGAGIAQASNANASQRNQVLQMRNARRAQRASFDADASARRAQLLNDAKVRNLQNILAIKQMNNAAEAEKYAALQTGLDQSAQFLSDLGKQNRYMNFINNDDTRNYGIGYNGLLFNNREKAE